MPFCPQANYGGVSVKLPKSLRELFNEDSEEASEVQELGDGEEGEGDGGRAEVQMNWNICKYLPEAASCQDIFRVRTPTLTHHTHTTQHTSLGFSSFVSP